MTIFLTNYERIKNFSVEELANWLDEYGILDGSPWMNWFNDNYCNRCERVPVTYTDTSGNTAKFECAWCELNNDECKFFERYMDSREIVKEWLEQDTSNSSH